MAEGYGGTFAGKVDERLANRQGRVGALGAAARLAQRHSLWALTTVAVMLAIIVLAIGGYFFGWSWTGFKGNTFWDWLSLLITPVTLAAISIVFTVRQAEESVAITLRQQQEDTLKAYFDHISRLLVENNLLAAPADSPIRAVARARTVVTLQQVGQDHRAAIKRFLDESGLTGGEAPILDLRDGQPAEA